MLPLVNAWILGVVVMFSSMRQFAWPVIAVTASIVLGSAQGATVRIDFQGTVTSADVSSPVLAGSPVTGYVQYSTGLQWDPLVGNYHVAGPDIAPNAFFVTVNGLTWGTTLSSGFSVGVHNDVALYPPSPFADTLEFGAFDIRPCPSCLLLGKDKMFLGLVDASSPYELLSSEDLPRLATLNLSALTSAEGKIYTFDPSNTGALAYEFGFRLDPQTLSVTEVPEPGPLVLVGLGLALAAISRRSHAQFMG